MATSVTAFVGAVPQGPVGSPVTLTSWADYERAFGGLISGCPLSYAVQQFFLHGGATAIVVRVVDVTSAKEASLTLQDNAGHASLVITAANAGDAGNGIAVAVDYATVSPGSTFNLTIANTAPNGVTESWTELSMRSNSPREVTKVLASSTLVKVAVDAAARAGVNAAATSTGSPVADTPFAAGQRLLAITLDESDGPKEYELYGSAADPTTITLEEAATALTAAVKAAGPGKAAYTDFSAAAVDGPGGTTKVLVLTSGDTTETSICRVTPASSNDASRALGLGVANGGNEVEAAASIRPVTNGTLTGAINIPAPGTPAYAADQVVSVEANGGSTDIVLYPATSSPPATLEAFRSNLQAQIRTIKVADPTDLTFRGATVVKVGSGLLIRSGSKSLASTIGFAASATANAFGLTPSTAHPLGELLGTGGGTAGSDGAAPTTNDYTGDAVAKTGLWALSDVPDLNLLVLPDFAAKSVDDAIPVYAEALSLCKTRRAVLLIDSPPDWTSCSTAQAGMDELAGLRDPNVALFFPRLMIPDPLNSNRPIERPPSGVMAGLIAATDTARGVWKAPAGQDVRVTTAVGVSVPLTDAEQGLLNPYAINALRTFPVLGTVSWGARTWIGADVLTNEYKYLPVRRTALMIEESLYRGLRWVVFEPNDDRLWAQIRLSVGSFMNGLFRQGAFQGLSAEDAYVVRCDSSTTTQTDIDNGIVNIVVGFAPLRPAEFVVLQLQQMAGQVQV